MPFLPSHVYYIASARFIFTVPGCEGFWEWEAQNMQNHPFSWCVAHFSATSRRWEWDLYIRPSGEIQLTDKIMRIITNKVSKSYIKEIKKSEENLQFIDYTCLPFKLDFSDVFHDDLLSIELPPWSLAFVGLVMHQQFNIDSDTEPSRVSLSQG